MVSVKALAEAVLVPQKEARVSFWDDDVRRSYALPLAGEHEHGQVIAPIANRPLSA
ncbi:hypothetical protein SAMN04488056_103250 [Cohaesibacter marisflavi]|uniref:Uncharacterized protein n=1 Tax=Cohaesibacter marisflavi TaxID=655353 RepID=A0A1I5ELZ5_9HYPH|nr:hypothetical protein SAMN04488056_103250 [Cohaesibacter marisflavi]